MPSCRHFRASTRIFVSLSVIVVVEYVGYESGDVCTLYSFAMLTVIKFCFELPIVFLHLFLARFCVSVYVA